MSKKTLYTNILGSLTKNGKKLKANNILQKAIKKVALNLNLNPSLVIYKLSRKLSRLIELKKIKVRKNTHLVPFPVTVERRRFLFSKELIDTFDAKLAKKKVTTAEKLGDQMMSFLIRRGSNYDRKKNYTDRLLASRSNAHYRW